MDDDLHEYPFDIPPSPVPVVRAVRDDRGWGYECDGCGRWRHGNDAPRADWPTREAIVAARFASGLEYYFTDEYVVAEAHARTCRFARALGELGRAVYQRALDLE